MKKKKKSEKSQSPKFISIAETQLYLMILCSVEVFFKKKLILLTIHTDYHSLATAPLSFEECSSMRVCFGGGFRNTVQKVNISNNI